MGILLKIYHSSIFPVLLIGYVGYGLLSLYLLRKNPQALDLLVRLTLIPTILYLMLEYFDVIFKGVMSLLNDTALDRGFNKFFQASNDFFDGAVAGFLVLVMMGSILFVAGPLLKVVSKKKK